MNRILILFFSLLLVTPTFAQAPGLIDSLEAALKDHYVIKKELGKNVNPLYDTTAAEILFSLSRAHWGNNIEKAEAYAQQSRTISEQIGYERGIGNALHALGVIHFQKGEFPVALDFYKQALAIRSEGDQKNLSATYNNIGEVYRLQGNYPEALKHHLEALKLRERAGDKNGIGRSYNNIGLLHMNQGNNDEALKNYNASLLIAQETGDKQNIAAIYNNLGIIYANEGRFSEALSSYQNSLEIAETLGDKQSIGTCYTNIGNIFFRQQRFTDAFENYKTSLRIAEEIGDKYSIALCNTNMGNVYLKQHKYKEASQYLNKALVLSKAVGSLERIKYSYESLATLDSLQGQFKGAYENYKLFILYSDSLDNEENAKKLLQQQLQFDFDKRTAVLQAEQEQKELLRVKELQKQKLIRNGFIGGFSIVLLFAGIFFRQRNRISHEKKLSETEKERSEQLLLNILPAEIATELKQTGHCQPKTFSMVTVMFADFKDFTLIAEKVSAELLVGEIDYCFSAFDAILQKHKIEKIKTVGDAYMCAGGLPSLNYTHAFNVVTASLEIKEFILSRKKEKEEKGEIAFEIRIGVHTGPVVAGIVGTKKFSYDIWGDTVNLAARMQQSDEAGQVNISGTTYELVKNKFVCTHRGKIDAKNKGQIDMYFVERAIS